MKTTADIDKELDELRNVKVENDDHAKEKREKAKVQKRAAFLNQCRQYLLYNPNESFLRSEVERLTTIVKNKGGQLQEWKDQQPVNAYKTETMWKAEFRRVHDLSTVKKQIETLNFLLT